VPRSIPPPSAPRLPAHLDSAAAPLEEEAEWNGIEVNGDFSSRAAANMDVSGCRIVGATFTGTALTRLRITDTVMIGCELSAATLYEAALTRVEFRDCRMLGSSFAQARLQDVRFIDCRLDDSEFRLIGSERLQFDACSLVGADFYGARLTDIRLYDCDLTAVEFSQANLAGGRLHGSTLEGVKGARYLNGVSIDSTQIIPLAMGMFTAFGVKVNDERE
jgi:uncharacterized protein YjbI with pentapeptide repeats